MKSNKKQQNTKTKEIKSKKKISPKPVEPEFESTSMNYFRMLKELEKQNSEQKLSEELEQKEKNINKPKQKNLTEIIIKIKKICFYMGVVNMTFYQWIKF